MVVASGVGSQWGFSKETTYGTYLAPTRFLKITKAEMKRVVNRVQAGGLNAGILVDEDARYVESAHHAEGSLEMPVTSVGFGLLLQQAFGSTATPVIQGATTAFLQTHTLTDLFGTSMSAQVAVPTITNQVANPYTMLGGRVEAITFTQEARGLLTIAVDLWGQDLVESQTLVAASYTGTSEVPFNHSQWTIKVGTFGAEAAAPGVSKIVLKIERKQNDTLDYANALGLASQPVTNDRIAVTGTITADFMDKTVFADRFSSAAGFSMINAWTGSLIASTFFRGLTLNTPRCRLTGDTPLVSNLDIVSGDFPFEVKYDQTNQPVSALYMSTDTVL